jgi:hypothetical protein
MIKEPGQRTMMTVFLHEDGPALNAALKNAAQCGLCCLECCRAFLTRFLSFWA